MSGSFLYDGLEPYGIQSPQISKQNRPGNVIQIPTTDLTKNVYAVFKLKKGWMYSHIFKLGKIEIISLIGSFH